MFRILFILLLSTLTFSSARSSGVCVQTLKSILQVERDTESDKVESPQNLELKKKDGTIVVKPASNAYFLPDGQIRPYIRDLVKFIFSRSASIQARIDRMLTKELGKRGMTFKQKNPKTGKYDKSVDVKVHGTVMPIPIEHFDKVVQSTGPVLRAKREILQKYIVNKSKIDANPKLGEKLLGLRDLDPYEREMFLNTLRDSIYIIEALTNKKVMENYQFLAVNGVDAALGKLEKMISEFFEFNQGTPSGLSNLIQILELIRIKDPKQYAKIKDYIRNDKTFEILKNAIDANARAWTGRKGISVVIGPSALNGAYPDVVAISQFSGMPLVRAKDLYIDSKGRVRLNTGSQLNDPVVTGIYSRAEESSLLFSRKKGVGYVDPGQVEGNIKLAKEKGDSVTPHFLYSKDYKRKRIDFDKHEPKDFVRDENNEPMLMEPDDTIGSDPYREGAPKGDLIDAILSKNLYVSNIAGRVLDDKGLFQLISKIAKIKLMREGKSDVPVAGPPPTLRPDQYHQIDRNPDDFVIKIKNESGGNGVHLMVNLTKSEQAKVLKEFKANPDDYVVQRFVDFALANVVIRGKDGKYKYTTIANDWRIFVMMFPDGTVDAGQFSVLIRSAKKYSSSTNTSKSGGYLAGVPLEKKAIYRDPNKSILPAVKKQTFLTASSRADIHEFIDTLNNLTKLLEPGNVSSYYYFKKMVSKLEFQQRKVQHLLGNHHNDSFYFLREYLEKKYDKRQFRRELHKYRTHLLTHSDFVFTQVEGIIKSRLSNINPALPNQRRDFNLSKRRLSVSELKSLIESSPLEEMHVVNEHDGIYRKIETEVINGVKNINDDPGIESINKVISELRAEGGELRRPRFQQKSDGKFVVGFAASAYFRLDKKYKPVIGLDLTQDFAIQGLLHEYTHFKNWKKLKNKYQSEGLSHKEAAKKAFLESSSSIQKHAEETEALYSEIQAEKIKSVFNQGSFKSPNRVDQYLYTNRMSYPEIEAIKQALNEISLNLKMSTGNKNKLKETALHLMYISISKTVEIRNEALALLYAEKEKLDKESTDYAIVTQKIFHFENRSIFQMIFSRYDLSRFSNEKQLLELFEESASDFLQSNTSLFFGDDKKLYNQLFSNQIKILNYPLFSENSPVGVSFEKESQELVINQ